MGEPYIHPQPIVESRDIGPDTRVWAFAHVMPDARVGAGAVVVGNPARAVRRLEPSV